MESDDHHLQKVVVGVGPVSKFRTYLIDRLGLACLIYRSGFSSLWQRINPGGGTLSGGC
jgi:hypothetical protein